MITLPLDVFDESVLTSESTHVHFAAGTRCALSARHCVFVTDDLLTVPALSRHRHRDVDPVVVDVQYAILAAPGERAVWSTPTATTRRLRAAGAKTTGKAALIARSAPLGHRAPHALNPTAQPDELAGGRFDSRDVSHAYLYLADSPDGAIAETICRDLPLDPSIARIVPASAVTGSPSPAPSPRPHSTART
nr:RES domain-containing protein [Rhodococcus wratislaviensis]GLK38392.1 hypothetical protein GCM10017611_52590 [Rhodococcus wratislaviensis]